MSTLLEMPSKATSPATVGPADIARRPKPPIWSGPDGNPLNIHGLLNGCSVFLIAGGPSFNNVDRSLLDQPGCLTMGINNSPKTFRPDIWTSVDDPSHFLQSIWLDPKIMKFARSEHRKATLFESETRIQTDITTEECPNVVFYESDLNFRVSSFLGDNCVSWGNNGSGGGGRSVMLAAFKTLYHLGAGHVFLLGVDFQMSGDYAYHFPQERSNRSVEGNRKTYKILSDRFDKLQPLFETGGFHVWNCNLDSKLKSFPFIPFEEAVKFAASRMPTSPDCESTSGLYDRIEGRNDSAETFAPKHSDDMPLLQRVDRNKRPKVLKTEHLDPSPPSSNNNGVLLFGDRELEWLLPWWFHHFGQSNPDLAVAVADFGLSKEALQWLGDKNIQILPRADDLPDLHSTWFYKPFAIASSPFDMTVFSDLDCEIRGKLLPMFPWIDQGLVLGNDLYPLGVGRKLFRESCYYNSGLIGIHSNSPTLSRWCSETLKLHEILRSDQEILNLVIYESEATIVELPDHFHQLRLDGDHREAVVMHWTGERGKSHIKKRIDTLNIDPIK